MGEKDNICMESMWMLSFFFFLSKMLFALFVIFCSVLFFSQDGKAESVGRGARIIEYGVPEQARFHMGAQTGTTVRLTAEATGTKVLSNITFTSSDTSACSIQKEGDYWMVRRLREGAAVIRMSCKADQDTVVRTLLMSNLTPLFDEGAGEEEEEEDGIITNTAKILVYDVYTGAFDYAMVHVKANLKKPKLSGKRKGKKVVLTWKKVKNATGYSIFQYKDKRYVKLRELGKGKTKYIIRKAKKGVNYRIQAIYNSQGQKETSKYSSVIKVK